MLVIETLSTAQKIEMFSGLPVGIFKYLFNTEADIFATDKFIADICLGYYTHRSAEKTISNTYEKIMLLIESGVSLNKSVDEVIANIIRSKYIDKWNRVYGTLLNELYNPLNDYDYSESKIANNIDTKNYDSGIAKTGNNSDVTNYNSSVENNGKTGTKEVTKRKTNGTDDVYGFNSSSPVGDSVSNEDIEETISGNADENTTHNKEDKTGNDTKTFTINENENKTGTDTIDKKIDEKITRNGRNTAPSTLIEKELDLRNKNLFYDIIYTDIDSVMTLAIYI